MLNSDLTAAVRVIHVISAILMIWPFYALVAVNQRARLGPPLGDRVDTYLENIIKNRTVPCYVFQATVLVSGLALIWLHGGDALTLVNDPGLGVKFLLLLAVAGSLTDVLVRLQPRIDALFAQGGGAPLPPELATEVARLRLRRKRMASMCLLAVLSAAVLGVQAAHPFPLWITLVFIVGAVLFTWRSYRSVTAYGWF